MKDPDQLLKEYVLRAVADDYEEFERILAEVVGWCAERRITADPQRVLGALEELISEGHARAYLLSSTPPYSRPVEYSAGRVDDYWFYVTPRGKQLALLLQTDWQ